MTIKGKSDCRDYVGIEPGLQYANQRFISLDQKQAQRNRKITEYIILKLVTLMRRESPAFDSLYVDIFNGGSSNEGLKITNPDEFDVDILMKLPRITKPALIVNNIPGYVNLQLQDFEKLKFKNPALFEEMEVFVDEKNYLLTKEMKGSFMESIFNRTVKNNFPHNVIRVGRRFYKIRMQSLGPAFTLTIEGLEGKNFKVMVDLVPCILLDGRHWPEEAFKPNPYKEPSDFFIVPKSPKKDVPHIERYWRLSFQKQEREIMFNRQFLKPTIRILKRLRDCFGHKVSSYALKTICLKKLEIDNTNLDDDIPDFWLSPLSYCFVYMLEDYLGYLRKGKISYFWNKKMDLLDNLTDDQKITYANDIERVLQDIKDDPTPETVVKYLQAKIKSKYIN